MQDGNTSPKTAHARRSRKDHESRSTCQQDATNALLFDHLVGAKQDRLRHHKAERLGGLEVHNHLKFCRELHREIARLRSAQDAVDIGGGATIGVYPVGSVGEQIAVPGKVRCRINRRYIVSGGSQYDRRAMHERECIPRDDETASRLAPKGDDGRFDFCVASDHAGIMGMTLTAMIVRGLIQRDPAGEGRAVLAAMLATGG